MKKALCLLSLLVLSSSDARAGVQPVGPEFHASTCANCRKWASAVAGAPTGTFAVVWEGTSSTDSRGILARFYTKNGAPRGQVVQANKDKDPAQYDANVAADAQGNYFVTWSQVGDDRNSDVFVQRFRSTGPALGAAVRVNVDDPAAEVPPSDAMPAIAATPNGGFVVAWIRLILPSATSEGTDPEIWFRRFDKNAAPLGAPIKLNSSLARGQRPSVCASKTGQTVVAWSTVDGHFPFQASKYGVALRRIASSGAPAGAEAVVARPTATSLDTTVSCAADGSHVLVWRSNLAPATDESDVLGLRFNAKGKRVGNVFRINTLLPGEQRAPSVSHDAAGNFVVVWLTREGSTRRVIGRRYRANGAADGAELIIYQPAEDMPLPGDPDVAHVGKAGEFVVVWPVGSDDLVGRRFKITAARR
jgi:hypothetical protein